LSGSLLSRLYRYQAERFPLLAHGLLIATFSFSAIAFSRLCRGAAGFIPWPQYLGCITNTFTLFFLVRVFDEHKDQEEDRQYRPYLPVPRGLVTLRELRLVSAAVLVVQIAVNLLIDWRLLGLYALALGYLSLMGKEFFISEWLRRRQFWYVVTHMAIIPLIDLYASAYDWLLAGVPPHPGLILFFLVSFSSGVVLEVGRKIRVPEQEEDGVLSYTHRLGLKRAPLLWLGVAAVNCLLCVGGILVARNGVVEIIIVSALFALCLAVTTLFLVRPSAPLAKGFELVSGGWAIGMYLSLGGLPMAAALMRLW
jgi:4-hydroxybenzoate polyprenyltransferase